jgi:hypothetical protein
MEFFTVGSIAKMTLELVLAVCMKLLCDNGRIHYRDFLNDFVYAIPGLQHLQQPADGLSREVASTIPAAQPLVADLDRSIAAK